MGSLAVARSNGFLYHNALCNDIVLRVQNTGARVLFGTHEDAFSAITIDSNVTTFTDALSLSNSAAEVWVSAGSNAEGRPVLYVEGDIASSNITAMEQTLATAVGAALYASNAVAGGGGAASQASATTYASNAATYASNALANLEGGGSSSSTATYASNAAAYASNAARWFTYTAPSNVAVQASVVIDGDLTVTGTYTYTSVTSNSILDSLNVVGPSSLCNVLTVGGSLEAQSNLLVLGSASLCNALDVSGALRGAGGLSIWGADASFCNSVLVGQHLVVREEVLSHVPLRAVGVDSNTFARVLSYERAHGKPVAGVRVTSASPAGAAYYLRLYNLATRAVLAASPALSNTTPASYLFTHSNGAEPSPGQGTQELELQWRATSNTQAVQLDRIALRFAF